MVNGGKKLFYIALQHILKPPHELGAAIQRLMSALAHPVGVTVVDELAFVDGHDHVAQSMVHHPIPEGRGADFASFGFMHRKMPIATGLVTLGFQFMTKGCHFFIQVALKIRCCLFVALSLPRLAPRLQQIPERDHLWI